METSAKGWLLDRCVIHLSGFKAGGLDEARWWGPAWVHGSFFGAGPWLECGAGEDRRVGEVVPLREGAGEGPPGAERAPALSGIGNVQSAPVAAMVRAIGPWT